MIKVFFGTYAVLGEPLIWGVLVFFGAIIFAVGAPPSVKPDYSKISLEHCHVIDNTGTVGKYIVQCD